LIQRNAEEKHGWARGTPAFPSDGIVAEMVELVKDWLTFNRTLQYHYRRGADNFVNWYDPLLLLINSEQWYVPNV